MQRSSCSRLRWSTAPNVLIWPIASSSLDCGEDTARSRTARDAGCSRVPDRSATVSLKPSRGFEPLRPGSKPGALPLSYESVLALRDARRAPRRTRPSVAVEEHEADLVEPRPPLELLRCHGERDPARRGRAGSRKCPASRSPGTRPCGSRARTRARARRGGTTRAPRPRRARRRARPARPCGSRTAPRAALRRSPSPRRSRSRRAAGTPSRIAGPPARWIAPSTPPPPSSELLAALTIASTACAVMSPCTSRIRSTGVTGRTVVDASADGGSRTPMGCPAGF